MTGVQSVEKPLSLSKNGVWDVAPRQVAGTPVPVFTPGMDAGRVCTRALQGRKANQAYTAFHGGKGLSARMPK